MHQDEPVLLYVSFFELHSPYTEPRDDQYNENDVDLPANHAYDRFDDQPLRVRYLPETNQRPENKWRDIISEYRGLVSLVDTHAGRILDAISSAEIADERVQCTPAITGR